MLKIVTLVYFSFIAIATCVYFFGSEDYIPSIHSFFALVGVCSYAISILAINKIQGYYNWLGFFNLFSFSIVLCGFQYPLLSFFIDDVNESEFLWGNYQGIGQATGLYLVSYLLFLIVYLCTLNKMLIFKPRVFPSIRVSRLKFCINSGAVISILLFFVFILLVGPSYLSGAYDGSKNWGGGSTYIFLLLQTVLYVTFALDVYKIRIYFKDLSIFSYFINLNKIVLFLFLIITLVNLYVGERGVIVQIALLIICSYYFYFSKGTFKVFFILGCIGAILMSAISLYRTRDATASVNDRLQNLYSSIDDFEWYNVTGDLASSCRINNAAIQYYKNQSLYGATMVTQVFSVIPFVPGLLLKTAPYTGIQGNSSFIFTQLLNPQSARTGNQTGAGTTPFGDLFINFNVLGIFIFFPILGAFLARVEAKANYTMCLYSNVQYGILLTWAIYWPRAIYLGPYRYLIWAYLITFCVRKYSIRNK